MGTLSTALYTVAYNVIVAKSFGANESGVSFNDAELKALLTEMILTEVAVFQPVRTPVTKENASEVLQASFTNAMVSQIGTHQQFQDHKRNLERLLPLLN